VRDLAPRWRLFVIWVSLAGGVGAVWGGVRGLRHLPTLPLALVEGAVIFGAPAALLGLVVVGFVSATARLGHRQ
jgi:hypothetical protein